jgi:hypothetical protein
MTINTADSRRTPATVARAIKTALGVSAFCALMAVSSSALAIPVSREALNGEGPWVVRVYGTNPQYMTELYNEFDVWGGDSDDAYAVIGVRSRPELNRLMEKGLKVVVDPNATERYRTPLIHGFGSDTIPNFSCYRTVESTYSSAESLVTAQPQLAEIIDIGDSWEKTQDANDGFDLRVLRLTNRDIAGDKPKLFVMSAIHARELATAELMTRFAERLVNGYGISADTTWILDHHEVHLLLQSNPDGRKQAEAGQLWRKNTNNNYCANSSTRGADLNRNFPWEWGGAASNVPCDTTYQGPSPASEPEVMAVVDYVRSIFPDQRPEDNNAPAPLDSTGVFIDVHSFSQLVLWPYGYSFNAGQAPNQDQLSALGRRLAFFNGYRPQQILGLTAASGSTADFAYGELGVASYAYELGTEFFQNCNFFESNILEQNIASMFYAAKVARTPYQTPSGPDITDIGLSTNAVLPGSQTINLSLQADGTRFSTVTDSTSPLENPRQVGGVNVYFNALPWADAATATATADDGGFDSTQESASASFDISGVGPGRYTIFTEAVGSDAQTGAISASFLHVLDPALAGTVNGQVLVAGSQTGVPDALVSAGGFQATTDAQGQFSLPLPAGSHDIMATTAEAATPAMNITVTAGQTQNLNLEIPGSCDVFIDDMESGTNGWTTTGNWALTTEQANSPTNSWHDSPGGNYPDNSNTSLISPVLDLSQASQARLYFNHICDTEDGFDFGIVEVSTNGSSWSEVYRCDNQMAWEEQRIDVPALDGAATAQFRFRLSTDVTQTDNGWFIDDVRLNISGPQCQPDDLDVILQDGFEL